MAAKCARIGKKNNFLFDMHYGEYVVQAAAERREGFTVRWEDRKEIKQTLTVEFRKLDDEAGWDSPGKQIILNNYWTRLSVISWIIKTEVCVICQL